MRRRMRTSTAWTVSLTLHIIAIFAYIITHPPKVEEIPDEIAIELNLSAPPPRPPRTRQQPQATQEVNVRQRTNRSEREQNTLIRDVTITPDQRVTYSDVPVERGEATLPGAFTEAGGDGLSNPALDSGMRTGPRIVRVQQRPLVDYVDQVKGKRSVVYCLDVSVSMSTSRFDKLTMAKTYMRQSLVALNETDVFNIVAFSREPSLYSSTMLPVTEENIDAAMDFLSGFTRQTVQANRQTDLLGALEHANGLEPNIVVLMTDGLPTAGEVHPNRIAQRFYERNPDIHLYAVGFGMGPRDPGTYMLQMLAAKNGEVELIRQ